MIKVENPPTFEKTLQFLNKLKNRNVTEILNKYGKIGVELLSSSTPVNTGATASQWSYEIVNQNGRHIIQWSNAHVEDGVNIAIILQYGHGTIHGGYVKGIDYINPALKTVFEQMSSELRKEVSNS